MPGRPFLLIAGAVVLALVAGLVLAGVVPVSADVHSLAPWIGFGGALLLFILAIRSRRT